MSRLFCAVLVSMVVSTIPTMADAKTKQVVLYMGLGDWLFAAPLYELKEELENRGAKVEIRPWWLPSARRYDVAAGQSMGVWPTAYANAKRRVAMDPVLVDWPGIDVNFYTSPKFGYPPDRTLSGSRNILVEPANHVTVPEVAKKRIADEILK